MSRRDWTRTVLGRHGFVGWQRFGDLRDHLNEIPTAAGGVYVIYRPARTTPKFLAKSSGGTWRGDPTETVGVLEASWVDGAQVVYIGKANTGQLRNRLRAYFSFGAGGAGRHYGGRYIWQLSDAWDCLVAWRTIDPPELPRAIEEALIAAFVQNFGARPFANLVG